MAPHLETEVKLRTDPQGAAKLRRSRWWRELEPVSRQSLHSIYYDTDDRQLRDRNIRLRTRTDGSSIVQTLKLLNDPSDTISRREWEMLLPDAVPNPSLIIDSALPGDFRRLTSADLQPVFNVNVRRETRRLMSGRARIDVSLDRGVVTAGHASAPVHEIELELVEGDIGALFTQARSLGDIAQARLHSRTKADVGYALDRAGVRAWSRPYKLSLSPDLTARASFGLVVLNSLSHLTMNDDCARLNLDVEGVHQCRVALRRLRSAFKIYRLLMRRQRLEAVEASVRWLGGILGVARDLDVLETEILAPAMAALGESGQFGQLLARLAEKKAAAYKEVREALSSPRYAAFLIELCALAHADDLASIGAAAAPLDQPVGELASLALSRAHHKLLKRGRGFETLSRAKRHNVRIALKRLRYTLDFFDHLFEEKGKKKFTKRLTRLQDDLGRMNDVAVAQTLLARLIGLTPHASERAAGTESDGDAAFAAGAILGWHRRRAAEIEPRLIEDWRSFVQVKPFWR
jgi:triphosphatase